MGIELNKQLALEAAVQQQHDEHTKYYAYTEADAFTFNGVKEFSVLDYWRYTFCQLKNQQDTIAEYLVARALGISKAENVNSWTGYDISYKSKRIEVKSTAYVHTWNKKKVSKVRTFSIAPSNNYYWFGRLDRNGKELARQNELYVFCLNSNKDISNADPLVVDDWDFYVVPTFRIDALCEKRGNPDQKTISLNIVRKIAFRAVKWNKLSAAIQDTIELIDQHVLELDEKADS
ncbi:MAG: hypothetical protein IKR85_07505 [Clostridia bacterium]|nr:hypothetical protein [Clostridia bacterium]